MTTSKRLDTSEPDAMPDETETVVELRAELARLREQLRELTEHQHLLRNVIDNSTAVIFAKDTMGRYLLGNRLFFKILRTSAEGLREKTDYDYMPRPVAEEVRKNDRMVMESGSPIEIEEVIPNEHGELRIWISLKFPLYHADGAIMGICGVSTDITDRKRAEQERDALQKQIIESQQAFLRELSTPLVPLAAGVLAMPLIGSVDTARASQIIESLLNGIAAQRARLALLDITGVRVVDTHVASTLVQAARAAKLLGAEVVLTGINAEVASALVRLGADLGDVVTRSTLESGIAYAYEVMDLHKRQQK
jgi:rsbT co-antagonist protein RsbR